MTLVKDCNTLSSWQWGGRQWISLEKTMKSGPFGTKEQNKKHMTPCVITCIHWGGHSGSRMGRDLMQWRRMKELVFLQYLANQSSERHGRYGVFWGALSEHCFSSGGVMEAISDSSPFTLHVSINTYWIECEFLRMEVFGSEPPTAWAEITKSGTHLLVNHSRLTYSILCPTCSLTYGKWMRF